jgi:hypothetical protein
MRILKLKWRFQPSCRRIETFDVKCFDKPYALRNPHKLIPPFSKTPDMKIKLVFFSLLCLASAVVLEGIKTEPSDEKTSFKKKREQDLETRMHKLEQRRIDHKQGREQKQQEKDLARKQREEDRIQRQQEREKRFPKDKTTKKGMAEF